MSGTPKPWKAAADRGFWVEGPDKQCVAEVFGGAQDMQDIVRAVNAHYGLVSALSKIVNNWGDLHPKDLAQARSALAKARGEAS